MVFLLKPERRRRLSGRIQGCDKKCQFFIWLDCQGLAHFLFLILDCYIPQRDSCFGTDNWGVGKGVKGGRVKRRKSWKAAQRPKLTAKAACGLAVAARGPVKNGWTAFCWLATLQARSVHRPFLILASSKESKWEQKMNCFLIDLKEVLLWARPTPVVFI